jgi:hypothetical protein
MEKKIEMKERRAGSSTSERILKSAKDKPLQTIGHPKSSHKIANRGSVEKELSLLKSEIKDLKERLENLEENLSVSTKIYDLASEEYELNFPVDIILKNISGDEVLALFPELELYGEGNIESAAIDDLKIELIDIHVMLNDIPDSNLSKKLKSSKRIINKLIKKRNENK